MIYTNEFPKTHYKDFSELLSYSNDIGYKFIGEVEKSFFEKIKSFFSDMNKTIIEKKLKFKVVGKEVVVKVYIIKDEELHKLKNPLEGQDNE